MMLEVGVKKELPAPVRLEIAKLAFKNTIMDLIDPDKIDSLEENSDLALFYALRFVVAELENGDIKAEKLNFLKNSEIIYSNIFIKMKRGDRSDMGHHFDRVAIDLPGDDLLRELWTCDRYHAADVVSSLKNSSEKISKFKKPFIAPPNPWEDPKFVKLFESLNKTDK